MQSKTTFTKLRRAFKTSALAVGFLSLFNGLANAQVYINGPLSTGTVSSSGATAPAGTTWSEIQGTNTLYGTSANINLGLSQADDFTVCGSWNISKATFYAYSTGYTGTTSPFTTVRVKIYNTDPSVGSPTAIYGDLTTNRFAASSFTNMYRIDAASATNRKIWAIEANINTTLPSGTYWIEWQLGSGTLGNFSPPVTVTGVSAQAGWNAKTNTLPNTWTTIEDGAPLAAQDMPFRLDYTTAACAGTPAPGNTIATATSICSGLSVGLSIQNCIPGSGVTYKWQRATAVAGPYTDVPGATSATYSPVITAANAGWYRLVATCSGADGTSTPIQISLAPQSSCYCIPPPSDCSLDDEILNVKFGTLDKSTSGCAGTGFYNYTATDTAKQVFIGAANPISVTVGAGGDDEAGVWIDYNKDGIFSASEFTYLGNTPGGTLTRAINVPSTVAEGNYRMRVRITYKGLFGVAMAGGDACVEFLYGETEDYTVSLVPCVPATITTQPVNQTLSCGNTANFSVVVAGSLPTVYWQYRTTPTSVWLNVPAAAPYSGVNTATLSVSPANAGLNGYQYRAVYTGACTGADFSSPATLTVTDLAVTVTPTASTVCTAGSTPVLLTVPNTTATASFTNSTAGVITDGTPAGITRTFTVTGITGAIQSASIRLNITHPYVSDVIAVLKAPNGQVLNIKYGINSGVTLSLPAGANLVNTVFSSTATAGLQTGAAPGWTGTFRPDAQMVSLFSGSTELTTGPTGYLATTPNFSSLFSVPNGTWTLAMYDYGTPDEGTFNNATLDIVYGSAPAAATFSPLAGLFTDAAGTVAYTGTSVTQVYALPTATTTYVANISTAACSKTQNIVVTVNTPISGTSTTTNKATCVGGNTSFTATAPTGGSPVSHQWKVSTNNGASFTNVTNGGVYSGATTATLNITGATAAMNGYQYKDSLYVASCNSFVFTNTATLTVNPLPVLTISANPTAAIYPGQTTTLAVASSTTVPATGYTWFKDGVQIANQNTSTLTGVDIDDLGTYTVTVADANSCGAAAPASITVTAAANDILFIYPSPNNGQFQIRYYSEFGPTIYPRLVNIYDSKGSRVYSKSYSINSPYTRLDVNASGILTKGIYSVELIDFNGNRIKTGRVVIN